MKWVSQDGLTWVQRKRPGRWYPKTLQLAEIDIDLEQLDPNRILSDLTVKVQRYDEEDDPTTDKEVTEIVEKANQDFLDDLDNEDEGVEDDISSEEDDEWKPEEGMGATAVKPRILKAGSMVFGKKPKGQPTVRRYVVFQL